MEIETIADTQEDQLPPEQALLALDIPRVVSLKVGQFVFRYHTRRISCEDWAAFYRAIIHQTIQVGGSKSEVFETESAVLEMVNSVVVKVDGYAGLHSIKDWRNALPVKHRMAVGIALRSVGAEATSLDSAILCDRNEVKLTATWPTESETKLFDGLIHRFRHPSIEELKKFNFETARVITRGDAENGISIYPSRQAIAMKLYDELIDSVEGYSVGGVALTDVAQIKHWMDGAHKAAAALQLFTGNEVEIQ